MNRERPVRLDLSISHLAARSREEQFAQSGEQAAADPQAQERFRQAMGQDAADAGMTDAHRSPDPQKRGHDEPQPPQPLAPPVPAGNPFGLLAAHRSVVGVSAADCVDWAPLVERIERAVTRLMVGEGHGGGKQVRMELSEDVLPGVTVEVEVVEGWLQVCFTCSDDDSHHRLSADVPPIADAVAQRLHQPVRVRVQTDDPDDPCPTEAQASPD